jgi:hypothetical protein
VNVADASWVAVGEMVYLDQAAGGPGKAGALQVTAKTGNQLTLLTPAAPQAGPPGPPGPAGPAGATGKAGSYWFTGLNDPPDPVPGYNPGDLWLNTVSGDIFRLA